MKNNEVKWALGIGMIMITICIVAIMISKAGVKGEDINLKIYKLNETGEKVSDYSYEECKLNTENLVLINREFKKAFKLTDSNKVSGKQILGRYKLLDGDSFIAFDEMVDGKVTIYRSDKASLYGFESTIFELVQRSCG